MSDKSTEYLRRAEEVRTLATCASSFVAMDELLDIAAAWRALAAEATRLAAAPVMQVVRPRAKTIRLVARQDKSDAA